VNCSVFTRLTAGQRVWYSMPRVLLSYNRSYRTVKSTLFFNSYCYWRFTPAGSF